MFQDLDATLAALIEKELAIKNVAISFAAPDNQFPPTSVNLPAISFFLYDVREDAGLRNNQWEDERQPNGMITRKRPPVRVTCSYLITAWPSASAPNPTQDEHRLLGALMRVLLRHRRIPATYLRGELIGQAPPVPTRIIADNQLHSLGEFWQALGGKPKATLHYSVTLSVDVFDPTEVGPEVKTNVIKMNTVKT
jgi:Pvc16 N-terminal domain